MEEKGEKLCKVCVTGASGYIGSSLIKKLLDKGIYFVHATLRNLGENAAKVGVLKSLAGGETRLRLFEADIYNPHQFEEALKGCHFVFHVATPLLHTPNSQYADTIEAAVAGMKSIAMSCIRLGTVKRLIYTASVVAASPLKSTTTFDFMDFMDENCWTPLNPPPPFVHPFEQAYMISKTQAEKEALKIGDGGALEVVTLAMGLVGGETLLSYTPGSVSVCVAQLTENETCLRQLRFLEELLGKIPIIHIDDVCESHIFCMEHEDSISGRFLCASNYVSSSEIAQYLHQNYPEFHVKPEYMDGPKRNIKWGSTKLIDKGFKYKYDMKAILDDSMKCTRRFHVL